MSVLKLFFISFLVLLLPGFQPETDKQVIAVQALFHEEKGIDSIWQKVLNLDNVSCAQTHGARPHMTIASFRLAEDEIDLIAEKFQELDRQYPSHSFKVKLSVRHRGDHYSYYLVPVIQDTLLTGIHDSLYFNIDMGFERQRKIDEPGSWWPHISMFEVDGDSTAIPDELLKVIENVTLKGFSLVRFGPIQYFSEIQTRLAK